MLNRRQVISGATIVVGTTFVGAGWALSQGAAPPSTDFTALARFLTQKPVDAQVVQRAVAALTAQHPTFQTDAAALATFVANGRPADVEALAADPQFQGGLRDTARLLISALYLGYVGTPGDSTAHDGVQFVTFTQALTYGLTHNYTPIPSYSRWGSGYWASLPSNPRPVA